jgi:hypothetical protein
LIDVPRNSWLSLISGPQGLAWLQLNPEVAGFLDANPSITLGTVFPGEARVNAPPPAPPVAKKAPGPVKLMAPPDVTSYSHGGVEYPIAKNRTITVPEHVADTLRSHGFIPV